MRMLSNLKYYKYNKGKLALLVIPLFISVFSLYIIHMIINSYYSVQYNAFIETRKHYTSLQARGTLISDDTLEVIKDHKYVEDVIPCVLEYTEIDSLIAAVGVRVYLLYEDDLREVVSRMNLSVSEGRFPVPGQNEVVLHEDILKNKELLIGDHIGNDLNANEKLLGEYLIVGSLKGRALAGFGSLESWVGQVGADNPQNYGAMIFAKEGKLDELNLFLEYLPLTGNDLSSYSVSTADFNKSAGSIYVILNIIFVSILIIVSVCLGFLTYLFYHGRLREFAVLHIFGYSRQEVILRNVRDVLVINAISALAGIGAAVLTAGLLNFFVFDSKGTSLVLFDIRTLALSLCVPVFCIVTQTFSIGISFHNVDLTGVVELENGGVL